MRCSDGVVTLRAWTLDDIESCVAGSNDPEVARWTRVPSPNTVADVTAFITGPHEDQVPFAIEEDATGELVGSISLMRQTPDGRAEIGYWTAAAHRGRGHTTRALEIIAAWALSERGLARLELHIDPANAASRRVAEKAGFALEGVLRSYEEVRGRRVDVAMYARLAG